MSNSWKMIFISTFEKYSQNTTLITESDAEVKYQSLIDGADKITGLIGNNEDTFRSRCLKTVCHSQTPHYVSCCNFGVSVNTYGDHFQSLIVLSRFLYSAIFSSQSTGHFSEITFKSCIL